MYTLALSFHHYCTHNLVVQIVSPLSIHKLEYLDLNAQKIYMCCTKCLLLDHFGIGLPGTNK